MKNDIKCVIFLIVIFCSQSLTCRAQVIDNKLNICAEILSGTFHGNELVFENDFSYPSLYNNIKELNGFSLKTLFKNYKHLSFGMGLAYIKASDWEYNDNLDYQGSKIVLKSYSPLIQIHNKYSESGIFNRGKVYFEIGPTIGSSNLTLTNSFFSIQGADGSISPPLNSNNLFYGVKTGAGFEWAFSQYLGVSVFYSYQQNWVKSALYCDTQFANSQLGIGIILRTFKDKLYLYR